MKKNEENILGLQSFKEKFGFVEALEVIKQNDYMRQYIRAGIRAGILSEMCPCSYASLDKFDDAIEAAVESSLRKICRE